MRNDGTRTGLGAPRFRDLPQRGQRFRRIIQCALLQVGGVNMQWQEIAPHRFVGANPFFYVQVFLVLAEYSKRLLKDTLQVMDGFRSLLCC